MRDFPDKTIRFTTMLLKRLRAPAALAASLLLASVPALASWDVDILPPNSPTADDGLR